jgi:hypothetical protein
VRRVLALLALAGALGCLAPPSGAPRQSPAAASAQLPGPKLLGTAAEVAREYRCAKQRRPLLVLEESALRPTPLAAGQEFGHRIVYALCPAKAGRPVEGKLRTRISFQGRSIVDDSTDFRALPGRWAIDTFIALPPAAEPGAYELELEFTSSAAPVRFSTKMPFSVWLR